MSKVNNDFLGVAFSGLRGEELFPIVSAVWGHCEVRGPLKLCFSSHFTWQVTLTYINGHHFDRESSPSWDLGRPQTRKSTVIRNGFLIRNRLFQYCNYHKWNICQTTPATPVRACCQVLMRLVGYDIVWHALVALKIWMTFNVSVKVWSLATGWLKAISNQMQDVFPY